MRFTPYITVLTALAGIASALPAVDVRTLPSNGLADLVDRDGIASVPAPGAISGTSPLNARKTCAKLPKAGKLGQRTEDLVPLGFNGNARVELDNVWYVQGNAFLEADEVKAGQKVKVYDLSGCSVVFVIGADGKPTTFHITAGNEARLVKSAAAYIQAQEKSHKLTPKSILVYTHKSGTTNYNDIVRALGGDLARLATHEKYDYDPTAALATDRWQVVITVGTTHVEDRKYNPDDNECGV